MESLKLANESIVRNMEKCEVKCQRLLDDNINLRNRLENAERAISLLQKNQRAKNIMIFGVKESEQENLNKKILDIFIGAEVNIKELAVVLTTANSKNEYSRIF